MTFTIVRQAEQWYSKHSAKISQASIESSIRSMEPTDIVLGQVELRIETIATVGSITFWNHGSVSALAINKQSRAEHVLDDRKLQPSDSVPSLLDRYFREITELESSR